MTLRIVVRTDNANLACEIGGAVHTTLKTFDIEAPALEAFLNQEIRGYAQRQVVGVETLKAASEADAKVPT